MCSLKKEKLKEELKSLVMVVRAIISSGKQPRPLRNVVMEYLLLEDAKVFPYAKFHFRNESEFFNQIDEFFIERNRDGVELVSNRPNAKSAHIAKYVREQKATKPSAIVKPPQRPVLRRHPPQRPPPQQPSRHRLRSVVCVPETTKLQMQLKALEERFNYELSERKNDLQKSIAEKNELKKEITFLKEQYIRQQEQQQQQLQQHNNKKTVSTATTSEIFDEIDFNFSLKQNQLEIFELKNLQQQLSMLTNNMMSNMNTSKPLKNATTTEKSATNSNKNFKQSSQPNRNNNADNNKNSNNVVNERQQKEQQLTQALKMKATQLQQQQTEALKMKASQLQQQQQQQQPLRAILGPKTNSTNQQQKVYQQQKQEQQHYQQKQHQPTYEQTNMHNGGRRIQQFSSQQHRLKLRLNGGETNSNGADANNMNCPITPTTPPLTTPPITPTTSPNVKSTKARSTTQSVAINNSDTTTVSAPKIYRFDSKMEPCTSILHYCAARNYGEPKYKVFRTRDGLFECQLTINSNTIYSTYPIEYPTELLAKQKSALKAINQIKFTEARNLLPIFPDEKEFLNVLYNELLQHPNGILSDKMSDWFAKKFNYLIPEHWFLLVKNSRRFTVEDGISEKNNFIILANEQISKDDGNSIVDVLTSAPKQMETIKLPWSEEHWGLYVKHCVTTFEIWACLLGNEYSTRLEMLINEIEAYMPKNKTRPDVIAPKHIYLVEQRGSWHRVRIESLDKENRTALCFFIDFGYTERLPLHELYLCESKFLSVPAQAVPFSLFGLETFASNPHATKYLQEHLFDRTVIGHVITKFSDFESNGTIQVIMYDTSTDEDINLNDLLQDEICNFAKAPQLKQPGTTSVTITHVDSRSGVVSVQINNEDFEYVQNALKQIIDAKFNRTQFLCNVNDFECIQSVLLVHDADGRFGASEWFRAKIETTLKQQQKEQHQCKNNGGGGGDNNDDDDDDMVKVFYIDYNVWRKVHISKIYRLDALSRALSTFPAQAIRVILHDIPAFNEHIIGRMRALLPSNCQAFVRVEKTAEVPHVTIIRKVDGPDTPYCNINDDLRLEYERAMDATLLTKSVADTSSNATTPDAITSPTQLFRGLTLASEPMLPLKIGELPKLCVYDALPKINSAFQVRVSIVSNPLSFVVQPYNEDYKRLLNMQQELQEYCEKNDAYIPADKVEIGQAYAAENVDGYYRVIAKTRYADMINVSYCDIGDTGTVRSDHLKVLPNKFRQLPIMGINARLYGIKGRSDDIWSSDDVQRIRDLLLGKKFVSYVKDIKRQNETSLELKLDLVNVDGEEDVNIREILLAEKRVQAAVSNI